MDPVTKKIRVFRSRGSKIYTMCQKESITARSWRAVFFYQDVEDLKPCGNHFLKLDLHNQSLQRQLGAKHHTIGSLD